MVVGFIVRLVVYALLLALATRYAQATWLQDGLDHIGRLRHFHDLVRTIVLGAPVVAALFGGRLVSVGVFAIFFLIGVLLTAPYVIARVVGA